MLGNVAGSFAADGLAARIRLEQEPELADAFAALDAGDTERGLDGLIDAIAPTDGDRREDLRRAVVGVLDDLGVEHPVARESRRKLATPSTRSPAPADPRAPVARAGRQARRPRSPARRTPSSRTGRGGA